MASRAALERVVNHLNDVPGVFGSTPTLAVLFDGRASVIDGAQPVEQFAAASRSLRLGMCRLPGERRPHLPPCARLATNPPPHRRYHAFSMTVPVSDMLQRPLRDLRISVTDRCNFRCTYCMPKEIFTRDFEFLGRDLLLSFEEIERLVRVAKGLGVHKVRITGGEPLLRRDLEHLIVSLKALGDLEVTMTTNGALLARKAQALKDAGLDRISVSLDSLDDTVFRAMNDVDFPVAKVLEGINVAHEVGLGPVKINAVVKRGVNDHTVVEMAGFFKDTGHIIRFIEFMDVGHTNGWRLDDVVPAADIVAMINTEMPLEAIDPNYRGEVARRYRFKDGGGEIGVIASVTQPFCGDCTRARISADGALYTCLFATKGFDLRALLRSRATDAEIADTLAGIWVARDDRYSEIRSSETVDLPKVEMSYIGG